MIPWYVDSMKGLGDTIYIRAFVKSLSGDVYISTPWPELFSDLPNVKPVFAQTALRTQAKNAAKFSGWHRLPPANRKITPRYGHADLSRGSIPDALQRAFRVHPNGFDLPAFESSVKVNKPIAFIRPATVRKEWSNPARNPNPEYLAYCADQLKETHHVIAVADLEDGEEWLIGDVFAHEKYYKGELSVTEMLGLVRVSDVAVGGVGWIVPASICYGTKLFCILGGNGGHNAPSRILPACNHNITFATPDHYCKCANKAHNCDKTITNIGEQWTAFTAKIA